jgi:hypothetical protein
MTMRSILLVGLSLAILLIFSCIILNASKYYHEFDLMPSVDLRSQPKIILHDRVPNVKLKV